MTSIKIIPMTLLDMMTVCKIDSVCFSHPWPKEEFVKELTQNRFAKYFVCKMNRKIIGFLGLWLIFDDAHIATIAVAPPFMRKGIGTLLVEFAIKLAKESGCNKLILEVRKSNEAAMEFYDKMGFAFVNTKKNFYSYPIEDAWEMIRKLTP
jgi:ribosomal-protein-alanine N-acetyltransferase